MTDELNPLAGAYALDALSEDETHIFEAHLADCADCADEVLSMQNAAAELSHIEAVPAPPQLRRDVLASITRVRPLPPVTTNVVSISRFRRARWATSLVAAACALFAVVGLGWGVEEHRQADHARASASAFESVLAAPDAKTVAGTLGGTKTVAQVVYSKQQQSLVMSAKGVEALRPGTTYQAWVIGPDNKATSLGTFKPTADGTVVMHAHADLTDAASVGVTVEPAGGSATPTGQAAVVRL